MDVETALDTDSLGEKMKLENQDTKPAPKEETVKAPDNDEDKQDEVTLEMLRTLPKKEKKVLLKRLKRLIKKHDIWKKKIYLFLTKKKKYLRFLIDCFFCTQINN